MMLRKIFVLCFAVSMLSFIPQGHAQRGKSEISLGYGYYSVFSFINKGQNYNSHYSSSSGTTALTYRYYITKDVTLGLGIGYENISTYGSFLTFAPEVTFRYLDTRNARIRVRLYGSVSYGMTVFEDLNVVPGQADGSGAKPWGFQATPFGVRIGRQVAWFGELGLGYKGLFHTGLSVRFPRILAKHHHAKD
jgi:hypothetical protein